MGGNPGKTGNAIAQASLDESRRQYNEQKAKEDAQKARAKANATSVREAGNMSYANNFQTSTNLNADSSGGLVQTSFGTPSTVNTLMGGNDQNSLLGG